MQNSIRLLSMGLTALLMIVLLSFYTVNEGQRALILQLGQIVMDGKTKQAEVILPGLHCKIPMLQQVRKFDTRLHTWDIQSSRIVTAEKKDVIVDYYFKWRIKDLALFFTRTGGNDQQAELLLEQQLNDSLRAEFGRRTISEVISADRVNIMDALKQQANLSAQRLGLEVVDVRVKTIDLPTEVSAAVFDRMRAERERVATEHRAEGKATAEAIRAKADANATVTIATAKANAARLRGEGDAEAAALYAAAYNKDASFYAFYRSLNAYKTIFNNKNDMLVLRPDSQFFKYFNGERVTSAGHGQK